MRRPSRRKLFQSARVWKLDCLLFQDKHSLSFPFPGFVRAAAENDCTVYFYSKLTRMTWNKANILIANTLTAPRRQVLRFWFYMYVYLCSSIQNTRLFKMMCCCIFIKASHKKTKKRVKNSIKVLYYFPSCLITIRIANLFLYHTFIKNFKLQVFCYVLANTL